MATMTCPLLVVAAVNLLTASVGGAPTVFVVHPLVFSNDGHLGSIPSGTGFVLAPSEGKVLLLATGPPAKHEREDGEVEQYDEGVEESRDWKEEDENETEWKAEKKEDYDNGEYKEDAKYEDSEDYKETNYEESTTQVVEDYTEKTEEESENYEKSEDEIKTEEGSDNGGQENGEEEATEECYDEKEDKGEYREGKSTNGESDDETGQYHPDVSETDERDTAKANNESAQDKIETRDRDGSTSVAKDVDKAVYPINRDQSKHVQVPEEIVVGSIDTSQVVASGSQEVLNKANSDSSSAFVQLNPPLKETEEVQLAPVVYHVSPKLLDVTPLQVTVV